MELRVENEAKQYCFASTNNYRQILTQQLQKRFSTCHFKMFSKPLSPSEELKTNKSVFYSEPEDPCFEVNYKFSKRHKKPFSVATTRKQENLVNTAQKMASQSSTKQNGEAITEEEPGSIVTLSLIHI